MTKTNATHNMNISALLVEVENNEDEVERTDSNKKVMEMKGVSNGHHRHALKTEDAFFNGLRSVGKFRLCDMPSKNNANARFSLTFLFLFYLQTTELKDGSMKWEKLLEEVENPNYRAGRGSRYRLEKIPLAVVAVAGDKSIEKRDLVNAMLVDWQIDLKMVHKPKGDKKCEYYAPLTQNTNLLTFLGYMTKNYDWRWQRKDFEGFTGCLGSVLIELYGKRLEEHGTEGYGKRNPNARMTEDEVEKLDLSKFDESNLEEFQMKLLLGFGMYCRGKVTLAMTVILAKINWTNIAVSATKSEIC